MANKLTEPVGNGQQVSLTHYPDQDTLTESRRRGNTTVASPGLPEEKGNGSFQTLNPPAQVLPTYTHQSPATSYHPARSDQKARFCISSDVLARPAIPPEHRAHTTWVFSTRSSVSSGQLAATPRTARRHWAQALASQAGHSLSMTSAAK